jgi:hypothetical protein
MVRSPPVGFFESRTPVALSMIRTSTQLSLAGLLYVLFLKPSGVTHRQRSSSIWRISRADSSALAASSSSRSNARSSAAVSDSSSK